MLNFLKSVRLVEHAVSAFGPECEEDLRGLAIRRFQQLQTKSKGGASLNLRWDAKTKSIVEMVAWGKVK
jgi:hypothetical protein